ncbi:MAG: cytochrome c biogenesis protein CcsA [Acidimicrobiales bacterium]
MTRLLGIATLVSVAFTLYIGLIVSPPDVVQGQLVRLIYVHPGAFVACYVGFGLCALASAAYLWPRTRARRWHLLAGAGAEVGLVMGVVGTVAGSIWGRAAWGVWWTWDARLTLTAILLAVFCGYLALRRTGGDFHARAVRSSVVALACFLVVPVDHYATSWWTTLHQGNTLLRPDPLIHGWQLVAMLSSFVAYGFLTAWLLVHRYRAAVIEDRVDTDGLSAALADRRAEGALVGAGAVGPGPREAGVR